MDSQITDVTWSEARSIHDMHYLQSIMYGSHNTQVSYLYGVPVIESTFVPSKFIKREQVGHILW